jgi:hypothetical protein
MAQGAKGMAKNERGEAPGIQGCHPVQGWHAIRYRLVCGQKIKVKELPLF